MLRTCGPFTARVMLALLAVSAGMFQAATTLLPSTFAMYTVTAASAAVLEQRPVVGEADLTSFPAYPSGCHRRPLRLFKSSKK